MTRWNADSMHRLAKLALDSGEVATPDAALELFSKYRLHLQLNPGWADTRAGQACFVTALNTAARAFLGGVEVSGDLNPVLDLPLYRGCTARVAIQALGGTATTHPTPGLPTLAIGYPPQRHHSLAFYLQLEWDAWRAAIVPVSQGATLRCREDNALSGVAAAALGVHEAFLHVRGDLLEAGHRRVGLSLWQPLAVDDWEDDAHRGPPLHYLPSSLWLVGLGHLGQAYAWTLGMLPYPPGTGPRLVLQDIDHAAESNLSTCMLLDSHDLGRRKVRAVAQRLEAAGFTTDLVERRFAGPHQTQAGEPGTALFGVDNPAARREIDASSFAQVVEAGLGSGYRDFRNIRIHSFPGPKPAAELWPSHLDAQSAVKLNGVYERLARDHDDLCGMTQLASRAVATAFVGSLAAAFVCAEVIRPLHRGSLHAALDLTMKDLRYRTGHATHFCPGLPTPYVPAAPPLQRSADTVGQRNNAEVLS